MLLGFTADSDSKFLLVLYVTQTKFFNGNKMKITPVILYLKKKTYLQYPPSCLLEDDRISASIVKNKLNSAEKWLFEKQTDLCLL